MNNPLISSFTDWAASIVSEQPFAPFPSGEKDWKSWASQLRQSPKFADCPPPSGEDWREWATEIYKLKG